jgi:DNA-binding MarR family transcriptional regulator
MRMSMRMAVTDAELVRAVEIFARIGRMLERIETGLTLPQYRMLKLLATGTERSTAIANRLAVSKPTVSAAVDALVDHGHVRRNADLGDKRVTWLEITSSGNEALAAADDAFVGRFGPLIQSLPSPDTLLAGLTELNVAFDEARERRLRERGQG